MPYWTPREETTLIDLVHGGASMEDMCKAFGRSSEAIRMKIRRLGLEPPVACKLERNKVTVESTTTTPITIAEDLISPEEALKMWLGCVKRLNEPGCTPPEVKRIRLILTALKGYVIVAAEYYERIRRMELSLERMNEKMTAYFEALRDRAPTKAEKAKWQQHIDDLKAEFEVDEQLRSKQYHVWPRIARRPIAHG